jgi:hypothetical protein
MADKMSFDIKKFKHVSSDDKSTTLQHPDGHKIIVAHAALSKPMRTQLEALRPVAKEAETAGQKMEAKAGQVKMAGGGEAMMTPNPDIQQPQPQPQPQQTQEDPELMAKRSEYNNLMSSYIPPQAAGSTAQEREFGPGGESPKYFDPNTWKAAEGQYQSKVEHSKDKAAEQRAAAIELNKTRQAAGLPPVAVPGGADEAQNIDMSQQAAQAPQQPQGQPAPAADMKLPDSVGEDMLMGGMNQAIGGINQEAAATGALGEQRAQVLDQRIQQQQDAQTAFKNQYDELEKERQAHISDIQNGYIDPNKYWTGDANGNGSHSKILTGIGMILAGFNPTSNPNAAVNFLKFQMEQNLQAQSRNLESKNNLLNANLKQFGNLRDATEMTRLMQNDTLAHQLDMAAAKAATPLAAARAQQMAGQLRLQTAPQAQQFAMRRAMISMANGMQGHDPGTVDHMLAYMRVMNPEMAKEMESRYVPGVGMASVPLSNDIRTEILGKQEFDTLARKYLKFAQQHSGSFSPAEIAQGRAMATSLANAYRNATHGGVYKEGEQEMINTVIPSDPTRFFNSLRTNPKIKELITENAMNSNLLKKQYGLPAAQEIDPHTSAANWARANPNDPRAQKILKAHSGQ